jgi:glycosyltransferase involved in cell wall biosynthesis
VDYIGGELKSSAYHGAELLVIPSRHEAMSIVALEAAISATPVLMTFNCGFSALADAGGAIEVEPIEQSLGNELKDILASKNLQNMGQKAYVFARDNYAWSIMADRFIDLCKLTQNDRS